MPESTTRTSRSRRLVAFAAWSALVFSAFCLWNARQTGLMRLVTPDPVAFVLAAFAAFAGVFAWMLFNPGRRSAVESPALFFAAAATLFPPPIIGFCLMPPDSPLRGWLALCMFLLCAVAVLSRLPDDFIGVPRGRHTYLMPLPAFDGVENDALNPNAVWFRFTDLSQIVPDTERPSLAPRAYLQRDSVRPQATARVEAKPLSAVDDILDADTGIGLLDDPWWDELTDVRAQAKKRDTDGARKHPYRRRRQRRNANLPESPKTQPIVVQSPRSEHRIPVVNPGPALRSTAADVELRSHLSTESVHKASTHPISDDLPVRTRKAETYNIPSTERTPERTAEPARLHQRESSVGSSQDGQSRATGIDSPSADRATVTSVRVDEPSSDSRESRDSWRRKDRSADPPRQVDAPVSAPAQPKPQPAAPRPTRDSEAFLSAPPVSLAPHITPTVHSSIPVAPVEARRNPAATLPASPHKAQEQDARSALKLAPAPADVSARSADSVTVPKGLPEVHRVKESDGSELIEGVMAVRFEKGQKRANLHVPFSPPLAGVPEVECECLSDEQVRLKVPVRQSYGIRIEARRSSTDEPLDAELSFAAFCTPE